MRKLNFDTVLLQFLANSQPARQAPPPAGAHHRRQAGWLAGIRVVLPRQAVAVIQLLALGSHQKLRGTRQAQVEQSFLA